jgi:hypothetical protein
MNNYDLEHLKLLTLIQDQAWAKISESDIHHLNTLEVCRYIAIGNPALSQPKLFISADGYLYFQKLSAMITRPKQR